MNSAYNTKQELDVISHTRAQVMGRKELTGENLFLAWGYPTAIVLLMEFAALMLWNKDWCEWLWVGIPLVGAPLMIHFLRKDYHRTGNRTLEANIALQMWIFIGFISCLGGFALGFAGIFPLCYCTFQGLLISIGCFVTGVILRFRPKIYCGVIGAVLSFAPLFFQGDLWPWQLFVTSIVSVVSLIIPGHLFKHYVKQYNEL